MERNRIRRRLKAAVSDVVRDHARSDFDYVLIARRPALDAGVRRTGVGSDQGVRARPCQARRGQHGRAAQSRTRGCQPIPANLSRDRHAQPDQDNQKNLLLAIVLSVAVLLGWQLFYAGPKLKEEQERRQRIQQQQAQAKEQTPPNAPATRPARPAGQAGHRVVAWSSSA